MLSLQRRSTASSPRPAPPSPSHASPEHRLAQRELEDSALAAIASAYLDASTTSLAQLGGVDLRRELEGSSRRRDASAQRQVLYQVIIAIAARTSDHPALVGSDAPSRHRLVDALDSGVDLLQFGRRREAICHSLAQQAIQSADEKGTLRVATPESVIALLLLEGLVEQQEDSESASRPYTSACYAHTRALMEAQTPPPMRHSVVGRLGWVAFMRDAITAATSGRSPLWSHEDVSLLRGSATPPLPLKDINFRLEDPERSFTMFHDAFQIEVVSLAADSARHLTGAGARRAKRMDITFARKFLSRSMTASNATVEVNARADLFLRRQTDTETPRGIRDRDVRGSIRGLRLLRCALVFVLLEVVERRFTAAATRESKVSNSPPEYDEDKLYWDEMYRIKDEALSLAFYASREMASLLKDIMDAGALWYDVRAVTTLLVKASSWVLMILNEPALEEGGNIRDWTLARKIEELSIVLRALKLAGWASERLGGAAQWLQMEIGKLREASLSL